MGWSVVPQMVRIGEPRLNELHQKDFVQIDPDLDLLGWT